jgi:hypothetical protein
MLYVVFACISEILVLSHLLYFSLSRNRKKIGDNFVRKLWFVSLPFLVINIPFSIFFCTEYFQDSVLCVIYYLMKYLPESIALLTPTILYLVVLSLNLSYLVRARILMNQYIGPINKK